MLIKDVRYPSAHISSKDGDWKKCRERPPESDPVNYRIVEGRGDNKSSPRPIIDSPFYAIRKATYYPRTTAPIECIDSSHLC